MAPDVRGHSYQVLARPCGREDESINLRSRAPGHATEFLPRRHGIGIRSATVTAVLAITLTLVTNKGHRIHAAAATVVNTRYVFTCCQCHGLRILQFAMHVAPLTIRIQELHTIETLA